MPELPDVEAFRRYLDARALGRPIQSVEVKASDQLFETPAREVQSYLTEASFTATARHGKYLFLEIDQSGWLFFHFGMTGYPSVNGKTSGNHVRLDVRFANGETFAYHDPRKLGRFGIAPDMAEFIRKRDLGPDALEIGLEEFRSRLGGKKAMLKAALMDQAVLAGIGNVYADEILFTAQLHPAVQPSALEDRDWENLHRVMREVLEQAIAVQADPERLPGSYLLRHRRKNDRCPRCGTTLKTMKVGGRTTYFCGRDQRGL